MDVKRRPDRHDQLHGQGDHTGTGVTSTQVFGDTPVDGSGSMPAAKDHKHGMPVDPVTAHVGAGDPHPVYATDTDLSNHAAAGDPHTGYATDTDLSNHAAASDPHTGYRLESADHSHQSTGLQGGQLDHGAALTGLADDDHPQYKVPPGVITAYGAASAPTGWLLCDGSAVSRTTYSALFNIIGTTFGAGDGSTTFNLPDLKNRAAIGSGTGNALAASDGQAEGSRNRTHDHGQTGGHTHDIHNGASNTATTAGGADRLTGIGGVGGGGTHSTDGGHTHNTASALNIFPFLTINFIIKT